MHLPILLKGLATVTENGVVFKGRQYSSAFAIKSMWFEKANPSGDWLIEVLYNPFLPNPIYYSEPETSNWVTFNTIHPPKHVWKEEYIEIAYKIAVNGIVIDINPLKSDK